MQHKGLLKTAELICFSFHYSYLLFPTLKEFCLLPQDAKRRWEDLQNYLHSVNAEREKIQAGKQGRNTGMPFLDIEDLLNRVKLAGERNRIKVQMSVESSVNDLLRLSRSNNRPS